MKPCVSICLFIFAIPVQADAFKEVVVTTNLTLEPGNQALRLIVRASGITIDGAGAILSGPGQIGDPKSLETAGIGILIEGASDLTLKNVAVHGFATGLVLKNSRAIAVVDCDFSDNYHNPSHGWGELPPRGGIVLERSKECVIRHNRANRVWNGILLVDSDENLIIDNDLSYCSNTAGSLWKASRNKFISNNFSYGLRIDRAAGEVHARDSTGVLIETGSNDNYWYGNDITHGGDGIFIRPLNRWVSHGNVFVENDASYANNNCVESWSPGNTFIRNKANHGSYGFWLGGSDQTVLIGNEAAYNGLTNGFHNAPEPGFHHGGIVIVGGPSSHTLIDGNDLHDNNGAGIAFRGDTGSKGESWRTEHWVVQRNRVVNNQYGIWGRWGEGILLAGNEFSNNLHGDYLTNVSGLIELAGKNIGLSPPLAEIHGSAFAFVGQAIRFEAGKNAEDKGASLNYHWWMHGLAGETAVFERVFTQPGYYRLGLTVDNGALAGIDWRDLFIVRPLEKELGTEGEAASWGFDLELNDSGSGRILFEDDPHGIIGKQCLRFTPNPYPGAFATVIFPRKRDAGWNLGGKKQLTFWIKSENPNLPGYQNAGPVIRLLGKNGQIELKPAKDGNLLNDPPFSEARWNWMPIAIPLGGDERWQRSTQGQIDLKEIDAVSLSLDSWGADPFTVWLDGLTFE